MTRSRPAIGLRPYDPGTGVRWRPGPRLDEEVAAGCYLQTTAENTGAVAFFERMGFVRHGPNPVVPGLRYGGRRPHQQTMVRRGPEG